MRYERNALLGMGLEVPTWEEICVSRHCMEHEVLQWVNINNQDLHWLYGESLILQILCNRKNSMSQVFSRSVYSPQFSVLKKRNLTM